jgi:hypothetical protein
MIYNKTCEQCGICFEAKRKHARFCSGSCRATFSNSNNKVSVGLEAQETQIAFPKSVMTEETGQQILAALLRMEANQQPIRQYQPSSAAEAFERMIRPVSPSVDEPEPELSVTKTAVDGRDYANNFLKAISGASGVNFIAPPETRQPERTIRINGEDVAAPKGIRKMDVPVLAAPNFDDDDDDLPLM